MNGAEGLSTHLVLESARAKGVGCEVVDAALDDGERAVGVTADGVVEVAFLVADATVADPSFCDVMRSFEFVDKVTAVTVSTVDDHIGVD